jgi:acetylornithine deacetylase
MSKLEDTIQILNELVAFPTVSADSNLEMIDYLASWLESAGARVDIFHDETGTKANLFATIGPEIDGGIVLSGHTDVVPAAEDDWTNNPFEMIRRDEKLYGRGSCDMKGFIAATIAMAPVLAQHVKNRPLHFAFTYDEEVGCLGGQALVDSLQSKGIRPGVAIIGEPTMMGVIEGHKGCCEYTTRFEGRAGHGSDPERGVNAVEYAVRFVSRLLELREQMRARTPADSRFTPPWTTINIGSLTGGVAHNVIPDHAAIEWEMRPVIDIDGRFIREEMRSYVHDILLPDMQGVWPDTSITTEVIGEVAKLVPVDNNEAKRIMMELTGAKSADVVNFGTEAGLFQSMGMDVVVCGPGSIDQAHKPDEFISFDQIHQCLSMLEKLGERLDA